MNKELKSATSVKTGKKFKQRRNELGYSIEAVSYTHLTLPTIVGV